MHEDSEMTQAVRGAQGRTQSVTEVSNPVADAWNRLPEAGRGPAAEPSYCGDHGTRAYRQKELRVSTAAAAEAAGTGCRAKTLRLSLTPTASLTHRVSAQEMAGPGSPLSELELWTRQGRAPGQSTW